MVFLMQVLIDRQRAGVVVALGQADRVAARGVAVLIAAVELVLLLIEAVHDVTGASTGEIARARWQTIRREDARLRAGTRVLWDVLLDAEGRIEKVAGEGGTGRRVGAVRR